MLEVTPTNNYFEVQFKYKEAIKEDVKRLKGALWNPMQKHWTVPLHQKPQLAMLGNRWGIMWKKIRNDFDTIPELPELKVHIPLVLPPFKYQEHGIAAGLMWQRFINADEPGLGKTLQAIATVIGGQCKCVLVICPATVKENWQNEFKKVANRSSMILTPEIKNSWHKYYTAGMCNIFICNYESLKTFFVDTIEKNDKGRYDLKHITFKESITMFDAVIIDEAHNLKDTTKLKYMLAQGICWGKKFVICLTGTPIVNKAKDMLALLKLTGRLSLFGGYSNFVKTFCNELPDSLREMQKILFNNCMFRRYKKDVLKDLPDKTYQLVQCEISNRHEYNAALADLSQYLMQWKQNSKAEVANSLAAAAFVRIQVCRNISARGKIEAATEQINEVIEAGRKIVVFVHQREIAQALMKIYPHAVTVRGDDTLTIRNQNIAAFQTNEACNIIIVSIKAGGTGITLTAASDVLFVEFPWHPTDVDQCVDRTHRIGQKNAVLAKFLLGKHTIDELMYQIIENKRFISNAVTGSEDGFRREVLDLLTDSLFKNTIQTI